MTDMSSTSGGPTLAGTISIFRSDVLSIHSYMSPEDGEYVRSHIIETRDSLVIIDVQLLRRYAREVRAYADQLGKPIVRVILTHLHPDHWFGEEAFADLPLYALPEVIAEMEAIGDWWIGFKKAEWGDQILDTKVVPPNVLQEGRETLGGVEFAFTKVSGAEATHTLVVELPQVKTLIAQDLVYNQIYLFVGELHGPDRTITCFDGWDAALARLEQNDYALVLPGHGAPTDTRIFPELRAYLRAVRQIHAEATGAADFKQRVMDAYPHYQLPLLLDFSVATLYGPPV